MGVITLHFRAASLDLLFTFGYNFDQHINWDFLENIVPTKWKI